MTSAQSQSLEHSHYKGQNRRLVRGWCPKAGLLVRTGVNPESVSHMCVCFLLVSPLHRTRRVPTSSPNKRRSLNLLYLNLFFPLCC